MAEIDTQTFQPPPHANLKVLKNKPRKNLNPGDFKNMRQIKTTTTDYLFQSTLYLISALCCTLLLLFSQLGSFSSRGCLGVPAILSDGEDRRCTKTLTAGDWA